jgi:hypothetical protein
MRARFLIFLALVACWLILPGTTAHGPTSGARDAWAQPATVQPSGDGAPPDGAPPENQNPDGGVVNPDGSPPPGDGDASLPEDSTVQIPDTTQASGWIISMPTGSDWTIGLGVLLFLWLMIFILYRSLLRGWVRALKHPANLRSLLLMLASLVFIVWSLLWFVVILSVFGWWMAVPLGFIAVCLFVTALVAKK